MVFHTFPEKTNAHPTFSEFHARKIIELLNQNFHNNHPNLKDPNFPQVFKQVSAGMDIEFVLAEQVSQGKASRGIVPHKNPPPAGYSYPPMLPQESLLPYVWDPSRYLNIVYLNVDFVEPDQAVTAFYEPIEDIMVYALNVKAANASFQGHATSLTHELGHYLSLFHPWGIADENPACQNGDAIEGTPLQQHASWAQDYTPSYDKCNPDFELDPDKDNDGIDDGVMTVNFMDYSLVRSMFTKDQVDNMTAHLLTDPVHSKVASSKGSQPGACVADHFEPNDSFAMAADLQIDSYPVVKVPPAGVLCENDKDEFKLPITAQYNNAKVVILAKPSKLDYEASITCNTIDFNQYGECNQVGPHAYQNGGVVVNGIDAKNCDCYISIFSPKGLFDNVKPYNFLLKISDTPL